MANVTSPIAEYLLQVNLSFKGGVTNVLGSFNVWKKAGMFGLGDDLMRFCSKGGCTGVFEDNFALSDIEKERIGEEDYVMNWPQDLKDRYFNWYQLPVLCPKCESVCARENLADSYGFSMPRRRIAVRMVEIFGGLDHNADVYLVRTKEGQGFKEARKELEATNKSLLKYGKLLEKARDRDSVFYSMADITKDAAGGSSLVNRFAALLGA